VTNRVNFAPQDFQRLRQKVEREHESKKLVVLLERVKQQIAAQAKPGWSVDSPKPPVTTISSRPNASRSLGRTAPSDR
jgi:hypothetical protein